MKLNKFLEINPQVELEKGRKYSRIMLDDITPGNRYAKSNSKEIFKGGGTRFISGDTLFARITPSLENGKIAQFRGNKDMEFGFGSTEFIVLRGKEKVSDSNFIFYLALTEKIRKPAEKSMFGASGRQRVDVSVFEQIEIESPNLYIQRKIADILSAYDDLIENNNRRIKILDEIAQAIYREWFVNFRFPGHEDVEMVESEMGLIPEGWRVLKVAEALELAYGKALRKDDREGGSIAVYGSGGIVGWHNKALVKGPGIIVGRKGTVGSVYWSPVDFFPIDTTFYVQSKFSLYFLFYNLQTQSFINSDAAVPGLSRNQAYSLPIIIPSPEILNLFDKYSIPIFDLKNIFEMKNKNLRNTRNLLLPSLISGELDVSELEIEGKV